MQIFPHGFSVNFCTGTHTGMFLFLQLLIQIDLLFILMAIEFLGEEFQLWKKRTILEWQYFLCPLTGLFFSFISGFYCQGQKNNQTNKKLGAVMPVTIFISNDINCWICRVVLERMLYVEMVRFYL